ncbi:MAG: DUF4175 family protein, partial [Paracoccus sp. (in: a-proteobacteria)]
ELMNLVCATCPVRDRAACSVLDDNERENLARRGHHRTLEAGEVLFRAGEKVNSCATLTTGALKVTSIDADGQEHILALVHPAGFIGEFFQPFDDHEIVALTQSQVCLFNGPDIESAMDEYPALARALLRRAQEDLHASRSLLALAGKSDAQAQVAGLIMGFAQAASDSPCHPAQKFELPLNLPGPNARTADEFDFHDLTPHPWAGLPVRIRLRVADGVGHLVHGDPVQIVLPERMFRHPVARAVIEQRKRLTTEPERRRSITQRLAVIASQPEMFDHRTVTYLALSAAASRLVHEPGDKAIPPVRGWFGHAAPFEFAPDYRPAEGIERFLCGTPVVLAIAALEAGVDVALTVNLDALREKSQALGDL